MSSATRKVTVMVVPDHEDGGFAAYEPIFRVMGSGPTREAALASLKEALEMELEEQHPDSAWYLGMAYAPDAEIGEVEVELPEGFGAARIQDERSSA